MTAKKSGASPDKRCECDKAFRTEVLRLAVESRSTQAAAQQLGICLKLLYRWQQAQAVGSVKVAREPRVRVLRAANKHLAQELDSLLSSPSRPNERH